MKNFRSISSKREGLKPPELYEYFLDNFWFKAAGLENENIKLQFACNSMLNANYIF